MSKSQQVASILNENDAVESPLYTLPEDVGAANLLMTTNADGTSSWASASFSRLTEVIADAPVDFDVIYFNGTDWVLKDSRIIFDATVLDVDLAANYAWTGTHTYTIRPTYNGATPYDTANIATAVLVINAQTTTAYTLVSADQNKVITIDQAAANTVTIPPNADVAIPIGSVVTLRQKGAGQTTIVAGAGVTLEYPTSAGLLIKETGEFVSMLKESTNTWSLVGGLTA